MILHLLLAQLMSQQQLLYDHILKHIYPLHIRIQYPTLVHIMILHLLLVYLILQYLPLGQNTPLQFQPLSMMLQHPIFHPTILHLLSVQLKPQNLLVVFHILKHIKILNLIPQYTTLVHMNIQHIPVVCHKVKLLNLLHIILHICGCTN